MKNIVLAISCLLCGTLLGVALSMIVLLGEFEFRGAPSSVQSNQIGKYASSSSSELKLKKIQSQSVQSTAEKSTSAEQTTAPVPDNLSGNLQFDNLIAIHPQSSIAEQQQVLSLIVNASLDELNYAMATIPNDKNREHDNQWIIGLLAQRRIELDPVGTLEEINQLVNQPDGMLYDDMAAYLLLENYARLRPESLIEWLDSLPENALEAHQLMSIYSALAISDPESAMELSMRNNSQPSNEYGGPEMILYAWSDKDPLAALQWIEQNADQQMLDQHAESIISQLASRDPEAARIAAGRFPELVSEDLIVVEEIHTLAESDPLGAIEMAKSISDSDELDNVMHSIFYTWSATNPIAAFEYLESIADSDKKQLFAYSMAESLVSIASRSPDKRQELLDWSESLSSELQIAVREPLLSEWANDNPDAAIEWLNTHGGWMENSLLVQSIAWNLPEHNMEKALEVYSSVDQETQMVLSQGIVGELYESDPQSAWNWYEGLPENDVKQSSLFSLILMSAGENPTQALDLATSVNNGGNTELITGVIQALSYEFPDEVESWLATANINEQQKTDLRANITQIRRAMNGYPMREGNMPRPATSSFYRIER